MSTKTAMPTSGKIDSASVWNISGSALLSRHSALPPSLLKTCEEIFYVSHNAFTLLKGKLPIIEINSGQQIYRILFGQQAVSMHVAYIAIKRQRAESAAKAGVSRIFLASLRKLHRHAIVSNGKFLIFRKCAHCLSSAAHI